MLCYVVLEHVLHVFCLFVPIPIEPAPRLLLLEQRGRTTDGREVGDWRWAYVRTIVECVVLSLAAGRCCCSVS